MIAGTGSLSKAPGRSASAHRFFSTFLPARESGSLVGPGIDGDEVVTAFRLLRRRPLVVIVEQKHTDVVAGFDRTLRGTLGALGIAVTLMATMGGLAWRSLRQQETVQATLDATRAGVVVSERDLRRLVESVHELIFRTDAAGRIVFVNGRWRQLTERPATDVLGRRVTDLCRDDERESCRALFSRPDIADETLVLHVQHATGRSLTLDLSVSRILDGAGQTVGYAGFALDVTQRDAARQALQSQLEFSAQLLEVSPTPIFVKDEQGLFVNVNRAWLDLMNLEYRDVLGRGSSDLFGADAVRHQEQDDSLLQSGERIRYENRHRSPGREPRDTIVTKVRFTRADGTPGGIVGSIVDVTEFREAERGIRRARDAAERANSAKSEFIANISHELRTPLQGIIGFSEIGRDMSVDHPDLLDMFTDIHTGGQRMLTLVNGLLDVSQMETAVSAALLGRVDAAQLVRECVAQCRPKAIARGLEFKLAGLTGVKACDVDAARFQQAVGNVLANAVRYSPAGSAVDIALADLGDAGIELTVRDRGPGIPDAELELIFEAFVQSSRTRDGSGGTGLGLTIARKIMAAAHAGSILAANADGGGASFTLRLPAAGSDRDGSSEPAATAGEHDNLADEVRS